MTDREVLDRSPQAGSESKSQTRRAVGIVGAGLALSGVVLFAGAHALAPERGSRSAAAAPASTPSPTVTPPAAPSTPAATLASEGGFPGDAEQQSFYLWAATHRVGSLNLPGLDPGGPLLTEVVTGYCDMLSEAPTGSGTAVTAVIRRETGASWTESRELLERSVAAFCPQKYRHLV
ncbi:hypothetical protein GCM10009817_09370 [Terrabacter lapilli]|uniref:DUF732 domain-containing protein n=1 Tax=Terrabacter lapilli TaxID=436231 RepID=A0ABN2RMX4_9MICO